MADELFSDGKILPSEIKPKNENSSFNQTTSFSFSSSSSTSHPVLKHETSRSRSQTVTSSEEEELSIDLKNLDMKRQNSKSFWGFKRSSSCGNGYARSLCPITLLSRSHSTGSSTSSKRSSLGSKDGFGQKQQRGFQKTSVSQKPPLRKSGYGYGNGGGTGNGIRVNPVLNLGFGSFFSGGNSSKNKNKK